MNTSITYPTSIALALLLLVATVASAQEDTATQDVEAVAAETQPVVTDLSDQQSVLDERAQARVTNLAANVSNRMDAAANRLQNISTRLESRIAILDAAGLDTTGAQVALASAQTSLSAAANDLARIDVVVRAAVTAENPRAAWADVRATYTNIKDQLTVAKTEIEASIQALKDAARTPTSSPNSNPTTTAQSADTIETSDITSEATPE